MYTKWIDLRNEILFDAAPEKFGQVCSEMMNRLSKEFNNSDSKKQEEIAQLLTDIAIDLQSYLPKWHLLTNADKGLLSEEKIIRESKKMLELVEKWSYGKKASLAQKMISSFKESKLIELSVKADQGEINNRWGNDNGLGIMEAMRRGAALVTTNPPIVNMAREERPDVFDRIRDDIKKRYADEPVERKISRLTMNVVLNNCRALRRVYEITKHELGYVNYQVNPKNFKDAGKMSEEIKFAYDEMTKALGGKPNVVFKVPGTKASIETVKKVTAMGIGVNITVNFSVPQSIAFAKAIEEGSAEKSYLTIMAGRLDDPIASELEDRGVVNAKELSRWASRAVTGRVYNGVLLKNGYKKSEILVASLRGPWNFDSSITDGMKSRIVISSFPDKAEDYDGSQGEIVSHINEPVPENIEKELRKSDIFVKAYDMDGMKPDGFDSYIPVVQTLTSFIEVYGKLENYMR
jgi:transaldolase